MCAETCSTRTSPPALRWRGLARRAPLVWALATACVASCSRPAQAPPPSGAQARRANRPAQIAWVLSLDVGGAHDIEVLPGTPIVFSVSLTGAGAGPAERAGERGKPWHTPLALEQEDGKPVPWRLTPIGEARTYEFPSGPALSRVPLEKRTGDEAAITPHHVHMAQLAIGPPEAARLTPGRYAVRAVLPRRGGSGDHARVTSEPVTIVVRERVEDAGAQAALERRRLVAEGEYHLHAEQFDHAWRVARQLVERDPRDADAQLLLGDAASGLRRDQDAVAAYREVLRLAQPNPGVAEPPLHVLLRLDDVQRRLGQQ